MTGNRTDSTSKRPKPHSTVSLELGSSRAPQSDCLPLWPVVLRNLDATAAAWGLLVGIGGVAQAVADEAEHQHRQHHEDAVGMTYDDWTCSGSREPPSPEDRRPAGPRICSRGWCCAASIPIRG